MKKIFEKKTGKKREYILFFSSNSRGGKSVENPFISHSVKIYPVEWKVK